jgi:hypothetical protein
MVNRNLPFPAYNTGNIIISFGRKNADQKRILGIDISPSRNCLFQPRLQHLLAIDAAT